VDAPSAHNGRITVLLVLRSTVVDEERLETPVVDAA
jgi:hypothetical protein